MTKPVGGPGSEMCRAIARNLAEHDAQHTLINYWWETTGWVRPDWEAIVDAVVALYLLETGGDSARRWDVTLSEDPRPMNVTPKCVNCGRPVRARWGSSTGWTHGVEHGDWQGVRCPGEVCGAWPDPNSPAER